MRTEAVKGIDELFAVSGAGAAKNPVGDDCSGTTTTSGQLGGSCGQQECKGCRCDIRHGVAENDHAIFQYVFVVFFGHSGLAATKLNVDFISSVR